MQLLDSAQPRVDRAKAVIHRVHVLGNVSKWGYSYSRIAQEKARPKFEGMTVGIDHDYQSNPLKVADAFGTLRNPTVDADGTWADLHYLARHDQAPRILEDIDRNLGMFALSPVSNQIVQQNNVVTSFLPIRVDVVSGAATTKTLLEQYSPDVEMLAGLDHRLATVESRIALREQFEPQTLQQTIATMTAGYDLSRFRPAKRQTETEFLRNHFVPAATDNASQSLRTFFIEA